jgi:UDP-N-acetylglucosamine:LPS N-acetylglucosamine transferase
MTTALIAGGGSGGHLIPALNIAAALRETGRRVVLVGAERGLEAERLPKKDFPYHLLPSEPIYRKQWWKNWRWPALAMRLVRGVDRILAAERPSMVIGTGGYAAGPVVWRAAQKGIPTAILEQDALPGLTPAGWRAGCGMSISASRRSRHAFASARAPEYSSPGAPSCPPTCRCARQRTSSSVWTPKPRLS